MTGDTVQTVQDKMTGNSDISKEESMDAVLLANFATEHVPYVERCLAEGK